MRTLKTLIIITIIIHRLFQCKSSLYVSLSISCYDGVCALTHNICKPTRTRTCTHTHAHAYTQTIRTQKHPSLKSSTKYRFFDCSMAYEKHFSFVCFSVTLLSHFCSHQMVRIHNAYQIYAAVAVKRTKYRSSNIQRLSTITK